MVVLRILQPVGNLENPSISAPNVTFNKAAEWDLYARDTCNEQEVTH
jgi:hypothetical protein